MKNSLFEILQSLGRKYPTGATSIEVDSKIRSLLSKYDLLEDHKVPHWLKGFLQSVLDEREAGRVEFSMSEPGTGDWLNFLGNLNELVSCEEHDSGEDVCWIFDDKLKAYLSFESQYYEVEQLQ